MIRDRLIACIVMCCLAFAASPALAQSFDDALAKFAADSFSDTEAGINAVAASGNPLAARDHRGAAEFAAVLRSGDQENLYPPGERPHARRVNRQRRQCAVRSQTGPHQQPAAPRDRGRDRRIDAALARSEKAPGSRAGRVQVARRGAASDARCGDRQGKRFQDQARAWRSARRCHSLQAGFHRGREARSRQRLESARRSGSACGPVGIARRHAAARLAEREGRHRRDPERSGDVGDGAECLVRLVARLGAAARGHRPCHHLRRDGRHQHGAWRDGDDRRLCHLRGAGNHPHPQSGSVRLFAAHRGAARLPGLRRARHFDRAHASSAFSMAARSRRCSRPGACR